MTALLNILSDSLAPLWEMSLTAAYVTAVVVLLRLVLKKRAPKQVLCLLWLVVFARLLIPVSLESPLSIVPDAGQVQLAQELPAKLAGGQTAPAQNPVQGQPGGVTADPVSQGNVEPDAAPAFPALAASEDAAFPAPRPAAQTGFPWQTLITGVWLAGALAMYLYGLVSYLGLKGRLYDAIRAEDGAWEHPSVRSPFILGILRPRVYLPAGLRGMPRQFILCHERAHLRRLDHIVKPICWVALALHWFNPAVWIAFVLMSRDIEAACDEAVIRRLGPKVKADYSATLLALATGRRVPAPCPLAFDEGNAKGRIQNVLRYRRPALWIVVVSVVMAIMAAVCLLTDPVSAEEPDSGPDPDPSASASPAPEGLNHLLEPWMLEVLNAERTFRAGAEDFNIHQLRTMVYGDGELPKLTLEVGKLALIDLNRDGMNEMVVWPTGESVDSTEVGYYTGYFIFHLQGDMVYVDYPGWRSIGDLKADGTFHWSSSAFEWGTGRARFNIGMFEVERIDWCEDYEKKNENGFVNGLSATWEEFEAAIAAQEAKPEPTWYVFEDGQLKVLAAAAPINVPIPLDEYAAVPVPDFLDADQQTLYRQTYAMYAHTFGLSTENVDNWPGSSGYHFYEDQSPYSLNGASYIPATGLYASWDDFYEAVLSVFTRDFWNEKNGTANPIYIDRSGTLFYQPAARGSGCLNANFPETFQLVEQTDDAVSFVMTGYYSDDRPFFDIASDAERQAWLAAGWEYSMEFPMRMVRTENGWRFDEFHCAWADDSFGRQIPNPNAPPPPGPGPSTPEPSPEPTLSSPLACEHGLDHVYVSTLEGTGYSWLIGTAHNTSMVYRCLEDQFTYVVPAPITGRDYWFGGEAEGDFDGDGRTEKAILQESGGLLMVCDVEDGQLKTFTFEPGALAEDFNQNCTYQIVGGTDIEISYQGETIRAPLPESITSQIANRGGWAPMTWVSPMQFSYAGGLLLSFPLYTERDLTSLHITANWYLRYTGSGIEVVPNGFYLTTETV